MLLALTHFLVEVPLPELAPRLDPIAVPSAVLFQVAPFSGFQFVTVFVHNKYSEASGTLCKG